jgi:hypothetical protein
MVLDRTYADFKLQEAWDPINHQHSSKATAATPQRNKAPYILQKGVRSIGLA